MDQRSLVAPAPLFVPEGAIDAAVKIARAVEKAFRESYLATGGPGRWPFGCCVEASVALRDELLELVPVARPGYVWGGFGEAELRLVDHAWITLGDGTYLDVTGEQFTEYFRLRWGCDVDGVLVLRPGDERRLAYVPREFGTPDGRP